VWCAIDGFALSVLSCLTICRSRHHDLSHCAVRSRFALTTDSAALSIGNNNADLRNSVCSVAVLESWMKVIKVLVKIVDQLLHGGDEKKRSSISAARWTDKASLVDWA